MLLNLHLNQEGDLRFRVWKCFFITTACFKKKGSTLVIWENISRENPIISRHVVLLLSGRGKERFNW